MSTVLTATTRALGRAGVTLVVLLALGLATSPLAQSAPKPDAPPATKPDTRPPTKPESAAAAKPGASLAPKSEAPSAQTPDAALAPPVDASLDPDRVMASLNRALAWYRQARIVMRSIASMGVFATASAWATR